MNLFFFTCLEGGTLGQGCSKWYCPRNAGCYQSDASRAPSQQTNTELIKTWILMKSDIRYSEVVLPFICLDIQPCV